MVERVHPEPVAAGDLPEPAARGDLDLVHRRIERGVGARFALLMTPGLPAGAFDIEVLNERPAERDVEHLDAAADREHRQVAPHGFAHERQLQRVALGVHFHGHRGVDILTVLPGIDVEPACEYKAVHAIQRVLPGARLNRHRRPAGVLDRLDVRLKGLLFELRASGADDADPRAIFGHRITPSIHAQSSFRAVLSTLMV